MAYARRYKINNHLITVTDLLGSDPSLYLSSRELRDLSDKELLDITHWFLANTDEIDILNLAEDAAYNEQFVSRAMLLTIIDSNLAAPEEKEMAHEELKKRDGYIEMHSKETGSNSISQHPSSKGWVYVLSAGPYYKIGRSKDIAQRIAQISPKLPFRCEVLLKIRTDDMAALESELHTRYTDYRMNGEWFKLSKEAIDDLRSQAYESNVEVLAT